MSGTYDQLFESVKGLINTCVLPRVVEYVNGRAGQPVTVDELVQHLNTQVKVAAGPGVPVMPLASPSMMTRSATQRAAPVSLTQAPFVPGAAATNGCIYQFKRGEKKNLFCGAAVVAEGMCRAHSRKYGTGVKATGQPAPGNFPFAPAQAQAQAQAQASRSDSELDCVWYKESEGLMLSSKYNFVLRQNGDFIEVLGKADQATNAIVPLSDRDRDLAVSMQMVIVEPKSNVTQAPLVPPPGDQVKTTTPTNIAPPVPVIPNLGALKS